MVILSMNCCVILPEGFFQVGGNLTWKWSEIDYLFGNIWTSFNLLSLSSIIPENPKQIMRDVRSGPAPPDQMITLAASQDECHTAHGCGDTPTVVGNTLHSCSQDHQLI